MKDVRPILNKFKSNIEELKHKFQTSHKDFFFTEKELHSYLYHLCAQDNIFLSDKGLNLVHAEYPTPFKCSMANNDFVIKETNTNFIRGHIDMVLLNPNFIDWIYSQKGLQVEPLNYVNGLGHQLFSNYIEDMIKTYEKFYSETHETILLTAVEFKYFKSTTPGIVTPIYEINQDLKKLEALSSLPREYSPQGIPFAKDLLAISFINKKSNLTEAKILANEEIIKRKRFLEIVTYPNK